jgi:hypothetical protein
MQAKASTAYNDREAPLWRKVDEQANATHKAERLRRLSTEYRPTPWPRASQAIQLQFGAP